jgi:hypothetical protein
MAKPTTKFLQVVRSNAAEIAGIFGQIGVDANETSHEHNQRQ